MIVRILLCIYFNSVYFFIGPNQSKTRQSSQSQTNPHIHKSTHLPQNQISNSNEISSAPSQSQTPISDIPQSLTFIPESEIYLWKPFADVMKVPVDPICNIETSILYLNSPYFSFKIIVCFTSF